MLISCAHLAELASEKDLLDDLSREAGFKTTGWMGPHLVLGCLIDSHGERVSLPCSLILSLAAVCLVCFPETHAHVSMPTSLKEGKKDRGTQSVKRLLWEFC